MEPTHDLLKGGLIRRGLALFVDFIVAEVLIQLLTAALFPLSGGYLVDSNSVFTACVDATRTPDNIDLPAEFKRGKAQECTKSLFGLPTARLYVVSIQDHATHAISSTTYTIGRDGRSTPTFDLGGIQLIVVALMRWAFESLGWRSLGRKWLSLAVVQRTGDPAVALARRYVIFALPVLPALSVAMVTFLFQLAGGSLVAEPLVVLTFLGNLPFTVALFAAIAAIVRKRDTFYDVAAQTTTVHLIDGHLEVAPATRTSFLHAWSGRAVVPGRSLTRRHVFPWLSCILVVVLTIVFTAEVIGGSRSGSDTAFSPAPNLFGAASGELVGHVGQWYRLVTAIFLHASLHHLLANAIVLLAAGWFLEGVFGRGWFLATFILGGIGASVASITFNSPQLLSVGASGAITAVLAAGLIVSYGLADDARRLWLRAFCSACLLAALQANGKFTWGMVDRASHFGGAGAGTLIGAAILVSWRRDATSPSYQRLAAGLALATAIVLSLSVVRTGFGSVPMTALLMPPDQLPKTDAEWVARSADIVRQYPADWRGHLARAVAVGDDWETREKETDSAIAAAMRFGVNRANAESMTYKVVAKARADVQDWSMSQKLYDRAVVADPNDIEALDRRAYVEASQGEFDAALTDMNNIAKLRPDNEKVKIKLSDVLFESGQLSSALLALDSALVINPNDPLALRQHGWIAFLAKQIGTADEQEGDGLGDLEKAVSLNSKDTYAALWLDIAAVRSGLPDRLHGMVNEFDTKAWPSPILKLFLGDLTIDQVMTAADAGSDPIDHMGRHCEAEFYIAEWQIMHGLNGDAKPRLQDAATTCPKTFYEFSSAQAELNGRATRADSEP